MKDGQGLRLQRRQSKAGWPNKYPIRITSRCALRQVADRPINEHFPITRGGCTDALRTSTRVSVGFVVNHGERRGLTRYREMAPNYTAHIVAPMRCTTNDITRLSATSKSTTSKTSSLACLRSQQLRNHWNTEGKTTYEWQTCSDPADHNLNQGHPQSLCNWAHLCIYCRYAGRG